MVFCSGCLARLAQLRCSPNKLQHHGNWHHVPTRRDTVTRSLHARLSPLRNWVGSPNEVLRLMVQETLGGNLPIRRRGVGRSGRTGEGLFRVGSVDVRGKPRLWLMMFCPSHVWHEGNSGRPPQTVAPQLITDAIVPQLDNWDERRSSHVDCIQWQLRHRCQPGQVLQHHGKDGS